MENLLNFLIEIGKLKRMSRKGWVIRGVKDPETIAAHTFRMAIMTWLLNYEKKMNINTILKMSLIHDLCEVYAGDITPYDKILPKDKKRWKELFKKWPRFSKKEKEKLFIGKYKKEKKALEKLIAKLPANFKREIKNLWINYEKGLSREGRFVRQLDRVENLLQALEYLKEGEQFGIGSWWVQIEELVDDPTLLKFIKILEEKFRFKKS